jgi:histidinol-phosphate phosphatase family protein
MSTLLTTINKEWSLFLDRDGVINERLQDDYVKNCEEFIFLPDVLDAIKIFSGIFGHIFVVTNQQGIGKGLMTEDDLAVVHKFMTDSIEKNGGRIDKTYYSPFLESEHHPTRKPAPGMALQAKKDFPDIRFHHSIMAGDSISDMVFCKNLGMTTVFISNDMKLCREHYDIINYCFPSLYGLAEMIEKSSSQTTLLPFPDSVSRPLFLRPK